MSVSNQQTIMVYSPNAPNSRIRQYIYIAIYTNDNRQSMRSANQKGNIYRKFKGKRGKNEDIFIQRIHLVGIVVKCLHANN